MVGTFTGVTAWGVTLEMLTLGALGVERLVARGVEMLRLGTLGVEGALRRGVTTCGVTLEMLRLGALGVDGALRRGVTTCGVTLEMLRLGALGVESVEGLTALPEMLARAVSAVVLLPPCLKLFEPRLEMPPVLVGAFDILAGPGRLIARDRNACDPGWLVVTLLACHLIDAVVIFPCGSSVARTTRSNSLTKPNFIAAAFNVIWWSAA
jgi:hypothetical protein